MATKYDWDFRWREFQAQKLLNPALTLRDYTTAQELPYYQASRTFTSYRRREQEEKIEEAREKLAKGAPVAAQTIVDALMSDDENVRLKAATANLDRVGLTPKTAEVNVLNVQAGQAVIAPIFADPDMAANLKAMLGGDE